MENKKIRKLQENRFETRTQHGKTFSVVVAKGNLCVILFRVAAMLLATFGVAYFRAH